MTQLTGGERVVRCLLGESTDRVPYGVGIGWGPWGGAMERWKAESGNPDLNIGEAFGFDHNFIHPAVNLGFSPAFEHKVIDETESHVIFQDSRGIIQRNRRDHQSMPEFLSHPVKDMDDWIKLKEERLRIDDPARITQDWDAFRAHLKASGEVVQVGTYPYGVFGTPRDFMGAEEVLVSFYTQPEVIKDMMDHLTTLWISVYEKVAKQVQIDHIHIWEDMSGKQGSLISPQMVREYMMPCYDRIADFARSAGVRLVSVDTDGDCAELVPVMMEHGINVFLPFEVQAGNDILEYRKKYPELGIIGGLDKRALAASKADIDKEVEKARKMCELGRYIPGFDHLIPPDVPWENYKYAAERIKEVCYGEEVRM